jgi:hypothetical protein
MMFTKLVRRGVSRDIHHPTKKASSEERTIHEATRGEDGTPVFAGLLFAKWMSALHAFNTRGRSLSVVTIRGSLLTHLNAVCGYLFI